MPNKKPYTSKIIESETFCAMVLVKKLLTPISKTQAYQMKLVDRKGDVIKIPETQKEKEALTILDRLIFKMKKTLDSRLSEFSKYGFLRTLSDSTLYNSISVTKNYSNSPGAKILKNDLMKVLKEHNVTSEDLMRNVLNESFDEYLKSI